MKVPAWIRVLFLCLGPLLASGPAGAESLSISLSSPLVVVASNFTGTEVVLFGTIERDASALGRAGLYSLVATVRGPRQTTIVRAKDEHYGLWLNSGARTFREVPSYLAVLASHPLEQVAVPALRTRFGLGLEATIPASVEGIGDPDGDLPYRDALVRLKREQGMWFENAKAFTFINPRLFRATIPIPANVPIGAFDVEVRLFVDGLPIATQAASMEVVKSGFEAQVTNLAREYPTLYGFWAAVLALTCGWLASVAFRRD